MSLIHLLSQTLIKNYALVAFFCGYFCIYLVSNDVFSYLYEINSIKEDIPLNLPFTYDNTLKNRNSLLEEKSNKSEKKSRILCWVMTSPDSFYKKAKHVKATWGRFCDILLFMSSQSEDTLPVIGLPVFEGYTNLWGKTKAAFYYVYKHYFDKADWFLKADDDTFVVVGNLRRLLDKHSPDSPIYFGRRFKPYVEQGYMSGGAGYVLSHEALKLFIEKGMKAFFTEMCYLGMFGAEDINIGECLSYSGVKAGDSRDDDHLETFHPYTAELLIVRGLIPTTDWIYSYSYYPLQLVSILLFSFYIEKWYTEYIVVLEYLIHKLKYFDCF